MTGLLAVLSFRFREALAGRTLWLLPLHFAVAFALVRTLPGPTLEARLQAADATALGLAAVLGLVAAAVMGATPLADDRLRPRGALLLASPVGAAARVLGTFLGTGGALVLLVAALCASALLAVDVGVGTTAPGDAGAGPRLIARTLHAAALFGGLAAVMGAAMALSTVTGAGVGAGGALALAMLSLFQPLFADAADTLAHAGAMERTIQATLQPGQVAVALTGTPPALAPLFRAVAAVLPDGTRFDLSATIAANEVPWRGDALHSLALGLGLAAAFLAVAAVAARRRP